MIFGVTSKEEWLTSEQAGPLLLNRRTNQRGAPGPLVKLCAHSTLRFKRISMDSLAHYPGFSDIPLLAQLFYVGWFMVTGAGRLSGKVRNAIGREKL